MCSLVTVLCRVLSPALLGRSCVSCNRALTLLVLLWVSVVCLVVLRLVLLLVLILDLSVL